MVARAWDESWRGPARGAPRPGALAAWPAALIDRGPGGAVRVSAFPAALVLFDPFAWTCARNSLLAASATTVLAAWLGVGLGRIVAGSRSWGRSPLWFLAIAPMAAGPLLIAPALARSLGGWMGPGDPKVLGISAGSLLRWSALAWTGVACGAPLVAMATVAGLRRVDPAWLDAALAVGSTGRRAWRDVTWPTLRPEVARASAVVFTLSLVEPAGPLALGLGRTLAVQIVQSATRLDQPTRSSTLALLAIAIAIVGRSILGRWGGAGGLGADRPPHGSPPAAGFRRASASLLLLAAWVFATSGPVAFWIWRGFREASDRAGFSGATSLGWDDPEIRAWLANSAVTAGLAVAVDLAILRLLARRGPGRGGRWVGMACRAFEAVPPLALGAGALALPWLLLALADFAGEASSRRARWLATEMSPGRSPNFPLVLALAAGQFPLLAGQARGQVRRGRVDAARLMGEPDRRAHRSGEGGRPVVPFASAFLAFAPAATSLAPALLLAPYSERRTIGPGLLGLLIEPGSARRAGPGPVAVVLGLNLLALAMATRGAVRSSPVTSRRETAGLSPIPLDEP